ncbi:hypothetical protein IAU59_000110 [Kwoniella sp. CBS 9459]
MSQIYQQSQPHPLPTQHNPIADQFLNAKAQSSRRTTYDVTSFPRRQSSTLPVVPENHHHSANAAQVDYSSRGPPPAPPSAFRLAESQRRSSRRSNSDTSTKGPSANPVEMGRRSPEKGKQKEMLPPQAINGKIAQRQPMEKRRRAEWIFDTLETQKGADSWTDTPRVVLVLGNATPASLAPLLYNPSFADTLLLVGADKPSSALEALLNPSSNEPAQTIFPTLQPFSLKSRSADESDAHALTVLLAQAASLAQQYKAKARASASGRSRANSVVSNASGSNSAPSTPAMRKRVLSGLGINGSGRSSMESTASDRPVPRSQSMYDTSADGNSNARPQNRSRISSFSRDSIFGGIRRNSDATDTKAGGSSSNGSLFDAVINFVPSMNDFRPERALQDMLHQAVVVTTGVMPSLTRQIGKVSPNPSGSMPVSLIHVLPQTMPAPLPSVIESFLLSLLPTFQARCSRELFGAVVSSSVWLSPFVDVSQSSPARKQTADTEATDVSGAEVLLFGCAKCPYQILGGAEPDLRPRAFLPNWNSCMGMPGLIAESRRPSPARIHHERMHSSPSSIAYADVSARTPPQTTPSGSPTPSISDKIAAPVLAPAPAPSPLPRSMSMPNGGIGQPRRSKLSVSHTPPAVNGELPHSPPTPDLDPSISSCASSFALGETGSQGSGAGGSAGGVASRRGSDFGEHPTAASGAGQEGAGGKKKGLTGWFKKSKGPRL